MRQRRASETAPAGPHSFVAAVPLPFHLEVRRALDPSSEWSAKNQGRTPDVASV